MFMATRKSTHKNHAAEHPDRIRTHSLAENDLIILQQLAQDASDYLGWTVSGSALVRALLRHAAQQETAWVREQLFPFIEGEITAGTVWGKKKEAAR